ncbi:Protein of unknown function [Vibrio xiamenensis]|uniref:DUF2919 domain-containing protein n=1 Tax=Vibrio xiamenensis TaxID=861298 RepID=A0A1G8D326_9VIBR|nr:DUF2919 domain-containing protein [Vibrio xiamenensis]SDH52126.1 Protein of unknown function [Vibrio xiamenensis]
MRYALEQYDSHGFLKAPTWLWLGWLFLAKAWVVFVVAGASRESGNKILAAVYPDHHFLYLGLALGLPSIIFMWLISLRRPERVWLNRLVASARAVTLISIAAQLAQTGYQILLSHGAFTWPNALTLVVLVWFAMYVMRSRSVRDSLKTPAVE